MMNTLYTAKVTNTGGRNGHSASDDGKIDVMVAQPGEVTGQDAAATNPEQLFGAAFSACYHGALELVLQKARAQYESSKVTAEVSLLEDPKDKSLKLAVEMKIHIDGLKPEEAGRFVKLAHTVCPYSKAIQGNIEVTNTIV